MSKKIAIDAMGGDKAPLEIVKGAVDAVNSFKANICLLGDKDVLEKELSKYKYDKSKITIHHTSEVIGSSDVPTDAIKNKKDSSMVVGLKMVKTGEAGAFISAGNTGALMAGATVLVGRIKGIERPAIGTLLPNKKSFTFLIDSGANADVKPHYLTQFAVMGSIYMENFANVKSPRVGLINVGAEKTKGNELYKECHKLLENSGLNFVGNIEGTDIAEGKCDVLVCDGFIGNIILKYSEGLSMALMSMIKKEITRSTVTKIAAAVLNKSFRNIKRNFDASEYGGAPLLGLKGLVVKAHGSSDGLAISNAVKQCQIFMEHNITEKITEQVSSLTAPEEQPEAQE